jgi:HSP20 family protein
MEKEVTAMSWKLFDRLWTDPWEEGLLAPLSWRPSVTRQLPLINIYGNDEKIVVTSEVPGLETEKLDINVNGRELTIKGSRELPELGEEECWTCGERLGGEFARTINLPYEVETGKVAARYERGVLTVELPRAEADKPRKIAVKAA